MRRRGDFAARSNDAFKNMQVVCVCMQGHHVGKVSAYIQIDMSFNTYVVSVLPTVHSEGLGFSPARFVACGCPWSRSRPSNLDNSC